VPPDIEGRCENTKPIRDAPRAWGFGRRLTNHHKTPSLCILQKWDGTAWTGFIWLRIGTSYRLLLNTVINFRVPENRGIF
jgi:hypothetical protein